LTASASNLDTNTSSSIYLLGERLHACIFLQLGSLVEELGVIKSALDVETAKNGINTGNERSPDAATREEPQGETSGSWWALGGGANKLGWL
jgi:hypothetical protein